MNSDLTVTVTVSGGQAIVAKGDSDSGTGEPPGPQDVGQPAASTSDDVAPAPQDLAATGRDASSDAAPAPQVLTGSGPDDDGGSPPPPRDVGTAEEDGT